MRARAPTGLARLNRGGDFLVALLNEDTAVEDGKEFRLPHFAHAFGGVEHLKAAPLPFHHVYRVKEPIFLDDRDKRVIAPVDENGPWIPNLIAA